MKTENAVEINAASALAIVNESRTQAEAMKKLREQFCEGEQFTIAKLWFAFNALPET